MRFVIDKNTAKSAVRRRKPDADKLDIGTMLSVCGSYGMAGAAIMSSLAALRSGVGLLKICVPKAIYPIMAAAVPEGVFVPIKNYNSFDFSTAVRYCSSVLIGCGLGINDDTRCLVRDAVSRSEVPVVIDADALNIVAEDADMLFSANSPLILTPHEREFARLIKENVKTVRDNREELALDFAAKYGVFLVLKGHRTVVASPSGDLWVNEYHGNAGMACGGSGDVLAGIIAALTAQNPDTLKTACAGVYIHAVAGDMARDKFGEISMLPTDTIGMLPEVFKILYK